MDRTLVILKPHAVTRGLTYHVLARLEDMGLVISNIRRFQGSKELWQEFYPSDESWFRNVGSKTLQSCSASGIDVQRELGTTDTLEIGRMVKEWLVEHLSSAPAVAAIVEGNEAARKVRKAAGATLPNVAEPGTIRFDYSCDSPVLANKEKRPVYNIIHASDPEEAGAIDREIKLVFGE